MKDEVKQRVGEAYAFFDCRAPKQDIEAELPYIRVSVQTPNRLELELTEGINPETFKSDELRAIASRSKDSGRRYVMRATCENMGNEPIAKEVVAIMNQAYQSPLYDEGEGFNGEIFYEKGGRYITVE